MRYFISDLHFGHRLVAEERWRDHKRPSGVDIIDHHDAKLIKQLSIPKKGDQIWVLGDISSGRKDDEEYALNIIQNIRETTGAQWHLIAGNHDSVSSIHKDAWKRQRRFLEAFDSVQQFAKIKFGGVDVLLSHFPYENLGDGPGRGERSRYNEFRLPMKEMLLIHGHTHQTTPHAPWTDFLPNVLDHSQYCVSWDVHRDIVKEDIIQEWVWDLMEKKIV